MPRLREVLYWSLDFNVDPLSSVLCHVELPSTAHGVPDGRPPRAVHGIDEIVLPARITAATTQIAQSTADPWRGGWRGGACVDGPTRLGQALYCRGNRGSG